MTITASPPVGVRSRLSSPAAQADGPTSTLRDLRRRAGRSAAEVAGQVGVHPMSITRWERGERLPGPMHLQMLAAALGVETATVAAVFDRARDGRVCGVSDRVRAPGLRRIRLHHRMPVRALAQLLDVPEATVYNWEAGRVGLPRQHLQRLAAVWDCDAEALQATIRTPAALTPRPTSPLRRLRRRTGLTQDQVATRLGVSRYSVSRWEAGQRPPLHALRSLARLYGQPIATVAAAAGVRPPRLLDPHKWRPGDLPGVLRTLRQWSGLTQDQVARHCEGSRDAVRGWERGRTAPQPARRAALEALYRLRPGALLRTYPADRP